MSGDLVVFHIHTVEGDHAFELIGPQGDTLIPITIADPGGATVDKTFTAKGNGTYTYFCTNSNCGTGHFAMTGDFVVGTDPGTGRGY